ncbi:MAG: CvpA family protein [Defluviitaleaceae bacterium]|nr:CvpA family protein [Defluviitaleaceae bacterium]
MTPYLIVDVLIIVIIAFFAMRGLRKGLVMAVASAVIFFVALAGAYFSVGMFSPRMEAIIEPSIGGWVDNRVGERVPQTMDGTGSVTDTMVFDALQLIGFGENQARQISQNVSGGVDRAGQSITRALTTALTSTVARIITFIIAFVLIMAVLRLAAMLLDVIAKLPILNTVNKMGGLAGGILHGAVIIWLIVYALRFVGVINSEWFENTYVLRVFGRFM